MRLNNYNWELEMKKIFNKKFYIVFLCSIVMPIALFSGLGEMLKEMLSWSKTKEDINRELLFNTIARMSREKRVGEDSAREIFENDEVQKFLPRWYSLTLRTKIGFMDNFIKYSEKKLYDESGASKSELVDYCRIISMATIYHDYLEKPFIKIEKTAALLGATGAAAGVTFALLMQDMQVLVAYKASVQVIVERLLGLGNLL